VGVRAHVHPCHIGRVTYIITIIPPLKGYVQGVRMTQVVREERSATVYVQGALCGLAAVSIWAGNIVVASLGLRSSLTPWDIAAIRFATAGLVLLPFLLRWGLGLDRLGWMGLAALVLGGAPSGGPASLGGPVAPRA